LNLKQQRIKIKKIMKRLFSFAIIGMFLATVLSSCGSSKGAHCDAYGDTTTSVEESDIAAL